MAKKINVQIINNPPGSWYDGQLGEVFAVIDNRSDFVLAEDYAQGFSAPWRHIDKGDCKRVE